jgi:hypothetical protein
MVANTSEIDSVLLLRWAWARKVKQYHIYRQETSNSSFTVQKEIIITGCHSSAEV